MFRNTQIQVGEMAAVDIEWRQDISCKKATAKMQIYCVNKEC